MPAVPRLEAASNRCSLAWGDGSPALELRYRRGLAMAGAPVTKLLMDWRAGQAGAQEALFSEVFAELRKLADGRLRGERAGHTLQPTALVHEVWLRMAGQEALDWQGRAHFFGIAARLMRQILIDHARARGAQRRDGGVRVDMTAAGEVGDDREAAMAAEVLELHALLERLAELDERRARVVELRFFGGLERREIAHVLGVSERMVKRDLIVAQAWLRRELAGDA